MSLTAAQRRNYRTARGVFDTWFDGRSGDREAHWLRLVAALHTESGCLILAHDGVRQAGGPINAEQSRILRSSLNLPHDGVGHNGGSVGALQQIPTPVARAADKPWAGWGTVAECMALETSIPKFLAQLRVTGDPFYKGKRTAHPVVADLLRVQQPLASEVSANYGADVVAVAVAVAAQFPREVAPTRTDDWTIMATPAEVKSAFSDALAGRTGLGVVKDVATGWQYVVGVGFFRAAPDDATLTLARKLGLVNADTIGASPETLVNLRGLVGDPKGSGIAHMKDGQVAFR